MPDRDWTIIVILGIGWGLSFFFNTVLLHEMGPLSVSLMRVATAALVCWVWALATGRATRPDWTAMGQLAFLGATMFALPFAIYPIGQQYIASGVAGIVNALTPVMVVIISHFWPGGERATPLKVFGVIAGFLGIVFLTIPALMVQDSSALFGTLIIVLAPVCYAVALNYIRRLQGLDVAVVTAWSFSFATLFLLPLVVLTEGIPYQISARAWGSVAVLGGLLTGVSFLVAFKILPRAGATKTSTVTFIAPVSALMAGYAFLGEVLTPLHFAGMAAIFLGLLLIDGRLFGARSAA